VAGFIKNSKGVRRVTTLRLGDGAEQSSRRSSGSGCEAVLHRAGGAEGEKGDWRSTRERGRPFSRSHRHHEKSSAAAKILPPLEELREPPLLRTSELDRRGIEGQGSYARG
jgi:hypothetical protein